MVDSPCICSGQTAKRELFLWARWTRTMALALALALAWRIAVQKAVERLVDARAPALPVQLSEASP